MLESGVADKQNNVLKNAPHTGGYVAAENWNHPYSREQGVLPGQMAARIQVLAAGRSHR